MSSKKEEWITKISNNNLYFVILVAIVFGSCYLLAFTISHLCGIDGCTVMTTKGEISSTMAIFVCLSLIPMILLIHLFHE